MSNFSYLFILQETLNCRNLKAYWRLNLFEIKFKKLFWNINSLVWMRFLRPIASWNQIFCWHWLQEFFFSRIHKNVFWRFSSYKFPFIMPLVEFRKSSGIEMMGTPYPKRPAMRKWNCSQEITGKRSESLLINDTEESIVSRTRSIYKSYFIQWGDIM